MNREIEGPEANIRRTYLGAWADSAGQVLGQISKSAITSSELTPQEVAEQLKGLAEGAVWAAFTASKQLSGRQAMLVSPSDAARLAQMARMEPMDESRPLSPEYREALAGIFRLIAGAAAQALGSKSGGETEFQFAGMEPPDWPATCRWGFRLALENAEAFQFYVALSPELSDSLLPVDKQPTESLTRVAPQPEPASRERNIDLLLDIDLEVAVRFGAREMPLREILELNAGAVVELDRKIQEPVELLLGGKIVARGEVVVMDGNYALRVTEIVSPMERVASLPRC